MITEPSARATQLLAFRSAALTLWGTGAWKDIIARLPADARDALVVDDLVVAVGWVPERHLVTLAQAVYDGPAQGSAEAYREFVKQVIALGFGRVRRFLVQLAPPDAVIRRASELWRHDHTHGDLAVTRRDFGTTVHVSHEVLTSTPLSCLTCAEMFRAITSLTRARRVRQTHELEAQGRLRVELDWV